MDAEASTGAFAGQSTSQFHPGVTAASFTTRLPRSPAGQTRGSQPSRGLCAFEFARLRAFEFAPQKHLAPVHFYAGPPSLKPLPASAALAAGCLNVFGNIPAANRLLTRAAL